MKDYLIHLHLNVYHLVQEKELVMNEYQFLKDRNKELKNQVRSQVPSMSTSHVKGGKLYLDFGP